MKCLRQWRMTKAIEQIETGEASISEIASQVGYESLAAFSRAFKSEAGATPDSFR
jgi:AraC-like DNA-binding protein